MAQSTRRIRDRPERRSMSEEPGEWTDEQQEALERWASKDSSQRHPHDLLPGGRKGEQEKKSGEKKESANDVTPEQCEDMRVMFKNNPELTIKAMAEDHYSFHRSTIAEHVFGRRCNHDIDEEPADSPMGDIDSGSFVQPEECSDMREYWMESREIVSVQEEFDLTYGQTYHHLVGRCKCDHEVPNIKELRED